MSSTRRLRSACIATLAAGGLIAFSQSAHADLLIDLRTATGGKTADVSLNTPITLDVWAKVTSPSALTAAAFQEVQGSFLSSLGIGNLLGTIAPAGSSVGVPASPVVGLDPFHVSASAGNSIDLDGDTDLDLGKANSDTSSGFVFIRSAAPNKEASQPEPPPPVTTNNVGELVDGGAAVQWRIGRISFTPTAGADDDTTNLNFRYRRNAAGQIAGPTALWFESTGSKDGFNAAANMLLGAPVVLTLQVDGGPVQWNVDANGSWNTAGSWSGGIPNGPAAVANFLGKITAPRTVTLDGSKQVKDINFDNPNSYSIAPGSGGGTLTIGDATGGTISVANGTHNISAATRLSGAVTKTGPGTLTLSGPQTNNAGSSLTVSGGQVNLNSNAGAPASTGVAATATSSINVSGDNAKVVLGASQDVSGVTVATAAAGTQGIDLNSGAGTTVNALRVYGGDLDAAKSSLSANIRNAATNPGDGIFDSGLHAGAGIGIAKIADANGAQHVQIRPTRIGDLNLDGTVTIADFIDLASNFNGTNRTWQEGDLNNDAAVTIADFISLASNFNSSYSGETWAVSSEDQQILASFAASIGASVPEPTIFGLMGVGALGLLGRRRRRAGQSA